MHQPTARLCVIVVGLIASVLVACAPDRIAAPSTPAVAVTATDAAIRAELLADMAAIRAKLAANDFTAGLDPEKDITAIHERRALLEAALSEYERHLASPEDLALLSGGPPIESEPPPCMFNGTLDNCFLDADHSIAINGTGSLYQLTSVFGSQSAVVNYTDNGTLEPPIVLGSNFSSTVLSRSFSFPAPNCNTAHTLVSNAVHQVSMSIVAVGGVSGHRVSPSGASCTGYPLTVTLQPSTIGLNGSASITVTGISQCTVVGVTSSNTNVATVHDFTNNNFMAYAQDPGTTTITASCGAQTGSAVLRVDYSVEDQYVPGGGGSEGSNCDLEDTYEWYHNNGDGNWRYMGDVCIEDGIIRVI